MVKVINPVAFFSKIGTLPPVAHVATAIAILDGGYDGQKHARRKNAPLSVIQALEIALRPKDRARGAHH